MPPRVKYTREQIVSMGVEYVRKYGMESLSARSLCKEIGCSPQPIFSCFENMEELKREIISRGYGVYLEFVEREIKSGKYPHYKSSGMAYIRFANEERELFALLFMRDRSTEKTERDEESIEPFIEMIQKVNGFTREQALYLHLQMWICVHGIAAMTATSYQRLDTELISKLLTDNYEALRARIREQSDSSGI